MIQASFVGVSAGHTTSDGLWWYGPNSAGGVGTQLQFRNISTKTIKYIYFYVEAYNQVKDIQSCTVTGKTQACLKYTGPLEPNKGHISTWENVWYNNTISYLKVTQAEVEYMDGSKETIDAKNIPPYETKGCGGCYVATAVYGSYDCPQVWTLRRYRDYTLAKTWYGRAFIHVYYAISPTLVKWFGEKSWFKKMWKKKLDKMVRNLNEEGVEDTPYSDLPW